MSRAPWNRRDDENDPQQLSSLLTLSATFANPAMLAQHGFSPENSSSSPLGSSIPPASVQSRTPITPASSASISEGSISTEYKCGFLQRESDILKSWAKRWYLLRDRLLFCCQELPQSISHAISRPYKVTQIMGCVATPLPSSSRPFAFQIHHPGHPGAGILTLAAPSKESMIHWIACIKACAEGQPLPPPPPAHLLLSSSIPSTTPAAPTPPSAHSASVPIPTSDAAATLSAALITPTSTSAAASASRSLRSGVPGVALTTPPLPDSRSIFPSSSSSSASSSSSSSSASSSSSSSASSSSSSSASSSSSSSASSSSSKVGSSDMHQQHHALLTRLGSLRDEDLYAAAQHHPPPSPSSKSSSSSASSSASSFSASSSQSRRTKGLQARLRIAGDASVNGDVDEDHINAEDNKDEEDEEVEDEDDDDDDDDDDDEDDSVSPPLRPVTPTQSAVLAHARLGAVAEELRCATENLALAKAAEEHAVASVRLRQSQLENAVTELSRLDEAVGRNLFRMERAIESGLCASTASRYCSGDKGGDVSSDDVVSGTDAVVHALLGYVEDLDATLNRAFEAVETGITLVGDASDLASGNTNGNIGYNNSGNNNFNNDVVGNVAGPSSSSSSSSEPASVSSVLTAATDIAKRKAMHFALELERLARAHGLEAGSALRIPGCEQTNRIARAPSPSSSPSSSALAALTPADAGIKSHLPWLSQKTPTASATSPGSAAEPSSSNSTTRIFSYPSSSASTTPLSSTISLSSSSSTSFPSVGTIPSLGQQHYGEPPSLLVPEIYLNAPALFPPEQERELQQQQDHQEQYGAFTPAGSLRGGAINVLAPSAVSVTAVPTSKRRGRNLLINRGGVGVGAAYPTVNAEGAARVSPSPPPESISPLSGAQAQTASLALAELSRPWTVRALAGPTPASLPTGSSASSSSSSISSSSLSQPISDTCVKLDAEALAFVRATPPVKHTPSSHPQLTEDEVATLTRRTTDALAWSSLLTDAVTLLSGAARDAETMRKQLTQLTMVKGQLFQAKFQRDG